MFSDEIPSKRPRRSCDVTSNVTKNNKRRENFGEKESKPPKCDTTAFYAELMINDKRQVQLVDGDYKIQLNGADDYFCGFDASWQTSTNAMSITSPRISFNVSWSTTTSHTHPSSPTTRLPNHMPLRARNIDLSTNATNNNHNKKPTNTYNHNYKVYYQFLLNSKVRQQTEAKDTLRCPWCLQMCPSQSSLLCHLKFCHPRFSFHCLVGFQYYQLFLLYTSALRKNYFFSAVFFKNLNKNTSYRTPFLLKIHFF